VKAYLTRRYHFSASHRLNNDAFTAEKNRDVYGKCNNPHGHGHNYVAEVTVGGAVDAATGMVCSLADMDGFARDNVVEAFDHMNLNTVECFANLVPTTENLTIEIYNRFHDGFGKARVERVRVEETGKNSFEYFGDAADMQASSSAKETPWPSRR
jgi:6-pyruvoyltetrahydropterin/6-carboxytetrahydropterin synthase